MDGSSLALSFHSFSSLATSTLAQASTSGPSRTGLWNLFLQSFDFFTVLLLAGSLIGVAAIFVCLFELRENVIAPPKHMERVKDLIRASRWDDLTDALRSDDSFFSRVLRAGMTAGASGSRSTAREAAELTASEESARWFRKIDVLSVIGNLGPLIGLAGTVWGMILAFTSLGDSGGQAGPADLSLGISKALFHTLLGLCLAIPCLLAYGLWKGTVDKHCTRAIVQSSEALELYLSKTSVAADPMKSTVNLNKSAAPKPAQV